MQAPDVEHKTIRSFDGTEIAYQVRGQGPAVVLANGLGGTYTTWRHQYALLEGRYKVICWDYRGLFRSGRPPRLETVALDQQTRDLELILRAEGVDQALFIGWSMGVQYNFEYYRDHPQQFAGMVVLNGVAGLPFETAFGSLAMRQLIPLAVTLMKHGAPVVSAGSKLLTHSPRLIPVLQAIGMVAETLDEEVFVDLVQEYSTLDFEAYAETLRHLGGHDASDLLHRIHTPALVVAGSRDMFTPLQTAEALAEALPDAELVVVEGGTHYAAVEFPREVNEHLREFLKKVGFGRLP
jgi:pimeloyl-ACP methyl ester carboxylesterase